MHRMTEPLRLHSVDQSDSPLEFGKFFKHRDHPEWGVGIVFKIGNKEFIAFFRHGGRRVLEKADPHIDLVDGPPKSNPVLTAASKLQESDWGNCHHNLYVVELSAEVLEDRKYHRKLVSNNPYLDPDKPCLYVGRSGLTPEERFKNHLNGNKAARIVKKHGKNLLPQLYSHFNPMPYDLAKALEPASAEDLRKKGHGAWQY